MARGAGGFNQRGMEIEEEEVGVRPTGIGTGQVRGFSTDLPSISFAGLVNAGKNLQQLGAELLQSFGTKKAREAAEAAPIEKDPETGQWRRPETPWGGLLVQDVYDRVVDQRFVETVYRDTESQLNQIAAEHFNDPEAAGPKFKAVMDGVLKAVPDQRLGNLLQPILMREVDERQRGILSTRARQDYGNEVQYTTEAEKTYEAEALGRYQAGDTEGGDRAMELAKNAAGRRIAMGADDPRLIELGDVRRTSIKNGAILLGRVEDLLEKDPADIPDTFRRLQAMLRGGGSDEDNVLGFTKQGLLTKFATQADRDRLAVRLGQIEQEYYAKKQLQAQTRDPAAYETFYQNSGRAGRNRDWSPQQDGELTQAYLKAKGLDPYSGATVEHLWRMRGDIPEGFYKPLFERAITKGPVELARLAEVFTTMQTLKDPMGNPVGPGAAILSDDDAAYMHVFSSQFKEAPADVNKPPEQQLIDRAKWAKTETDKLIKSGADTLKDVTTIGGFAGVVNRQREAEGLKRFEQADMVTDLASRFDQWGPDGGSADMAAALSPQNKQDLVRSTANLMAKGMSYEKAADQAVARFKNTHRQDPYVLAPGGKGGGWVHNDYAIPRVTDIRKGGAAQTSEYIKPYVEGAFWINEDGTPAEKSKLDEVKVLIPRKQWGVTIDQPELGKNIMLVPTGVSTRNQQYHVVAIGPDGTPTPPLTNRKGTAILLRLGEAHKEQSAEITKRMTNPGYRTMAEEREKALGGAVLGGAAGTMGKPDLIADVMKAAPAPADPLKIIDPTSYGATTEPNLQQTGKTGGRGAKVLDYPRRDDGLPDPLSALPIPDPDKPGVKAGKVSYQSDTQLYESDRNGGFVIPGSGAVVPAQATFQIPGLSDEQHYQLASMRRDPRTRLAGMHPGLAGGLADMIAAMPKEVRSEFKIGSAVRTREEQTGIYRAAVAKRGAMARKWAAKPGGSKHEDSNGGMAADLSMGPAARAWVHRNAASFGLWFPMKHEPWHIEPIGSRGQRVSALDDDADSEAEA